MPPVLNVPAAFYGLGAPTRKFWKQLFRKALKAGAWEPALADVPMVDLVAQQGMIFNEVLRGGGLRKEVMAQEAWWLAWIPITRPNATKGSDSANSAVLGKDQHLILQGMDHFWYALGMASAQHFRLPRPFGADEQWGVDFLLPFINKLVVWLPDIQLFGRRIFNADTAETTLRLINEDTSLRWSYSLMHFLYQCGYYPCPHENWYEEVQQRYGNDVVAFLLDSEVIEWNGNRYQLREDTREPVRW